MRSPKLTALVKDAGKAGFTIESRPDGTIRISKYKGPDITIWPSRVATRNDVRLDLATNMRTYREMRAALGLPTDESR